MRPRQQTIVSRRVLSTSLFLILFLLAPGAEPQLRPLAAQTVTPAAVVKSIVFSNQELSDAGSHAVATRASGETISVTAGLLLFRGDIIETFDDTKVTVLFLDAPVSERDNEVIIEAKAKIGISSTNSWWGKIWVKVKGAFESKGTYVRLGPKGTEFEFDVTRGSEVPTIIVLEGSVAYKEGIFPLAGLGMINKQFAELLEMGRLSPVPFFTAFAHRVSGQVQTARVLDVQAGQVTDFSATYHVLNGCKTTHYFEFRTSDRTPWLQLLVQKKAEIPAGVTLPVEASVRIDATQLLPGQYRADVYAICLDCQSEPGCIQSQLDWPLSVTVKAPLNPTPTPTPTPTPNPSPTVAPGSSTQEGQIGELQELTLTSAVDRPVQATENRVLSVLDWTNKVILTTQPTYSAQNIIPHFATIEQRSQSFKNARERAILRNEVGSHAILGDVYSDWDQGALAVFAYEKERAPGGNRPGIFDADKAEAYRLTGQLSRANQLLGALSSPDSQSVPALNALGNLNLDYAEIALDKRDYAQATTRLQQAKSLYGSALQGAQVTVSGGGGPNPVTTVQTNLGETSLSEGDVARKQGDLQKARASYTEATRSLESIQQANSIYPFPVTDLGRAYQGLGNVAHLEGNASEASAAYERADRQHRQAIAAHSDFGEAYFNLGDLFDDRGDKKSAEANYRLAIKARPEQPAPYYPLALLIQKEDPQLAAALAATYLQLEPEVFKQGEKARNAGLITQRQYVEPPPRPFDQRRTTDGTVPNVLNMTKAQALSVMQSAGFVPGTIDDKRNRSTDIVFTQQPSAGTKAARGSAINLVIDKPIDVPEVLDDREATAIKKLTEKRLVVGTTEHQPSCKSVGKVLRQSPAKDAKVGPGTPINLVFGSVGENPIVVPDFRGLDRRGVDTTLRENRISLGKTKTEETDSAPEGSVFKQSPDPGTQFANFCQVSVELTIAIPWTIVDNYVGLPLGEAQQRLNANNLYGVVSYSESEGQPGMVVSQSPPPGSKVSRRSLVRLTVSRKPIPIVMPDVVGKQFSVASALLQNLGLRVAKPRCELTSLPSVTHQRVQISPGTVVRQDIPQGTTVTRGTVVTLTVANNSCPESGELR
jgi:beta-lactam-binding protein with PASTA domain/tetratricopeptide (TPR) repeat protein